MTERRIMQLKADGIDVKKVKRACEHIFAYIEQESFSLKETKELVSSMGIVARNMTKNDPSRKVGDFDYSSSIEDLFPFNAASKATS